MKVKDLGFWPPEPAGGFKAGEAFPGSLDEVKVESYLITDQGIVIFTCRFRERVLVYRIFIARPRNAERFIRILYRNRGKSLSELGDLELTPHVVQI